MTDLLSDLRFGFRMLRKRAGTSVLAAVAVAIGIGLTTTMFSIVEGVFLRGLPFDHGKRIVYVGRTSAKGGDSQSATVDDYLDWAARQRSFEGLAGERRMDASVFDGDGAMRTTLARVTPNAFQVLHAVPQAGRDFVAADGAPGAPPVAIISDQLWTVTFARDPSTVGRVVRIDGTPTTIIGIMPPRFGFPEEQNLWMPLDVSRPSRRGDGPRIDVVGRLRAGVSLSQATAEMRAIGAALAAEHPENKDTGATVVPYVDRFLGDQIIGVLTAMLVAVSGVMLIACVNVGNLQLARAAERQLEVAVRTALGASRPRILRQLLVEGLMLTMAGALLGLLVAAAAMALFTRAIADTNPPFWIDIRLDPTVLLFVAGLIVAATLAGSLVPALRATRQNVNAALKDEGRGNTGLRIGRFAHGLVVAEVLLSCCLLVVSGLMIKSIVTVTHLSYPYRTADVFKGNTSMSETRYPDAASRGRLIEAVLASLGRVPELRSVALASGTPADAGGAQVQIEGQEATTKASTPWLRVMRATPGVLDVLGVSVREGRGFTSADAAAADPVALVTPGVAKQFPGGHALGHRLRLGTTEKAPWLTVVGVLPQLVTNDVGPHELGPDLIMIPLAQDPQSFFVVLGDTSGDPAAAAPSVRRALASVDRDLWLDMPGSLAGAYARRAWPYRVFGSLFLSFGFCALVLASAGLYGVMAFGVRQRRQEIGVRMALGADRRTILVLVLRQGLTRVALGAVLGLAPAWLLAAAMGELMFGVRPTDPVVLGSTLGVLFATGFLASIVPARRAAATDPLVTLKES